MFSSLLYGTENMPGLWQIGKAFIELLGNGTLFRYSVASLFRVTLGFYIAALLAVPLGLFLGRRRFINRWANPFIQFLRPISPLAWIPFAMIWFGIGDQPALFIIFIGSFFPILLSAINAAAMIPSMYFQVAANLQFKVWESLCYVIIPATVPSIVLGLRVALGIVALVRHLTRPGAQYRAWPSCSPRHCVDGCCCGRDDRCEKRSRLSHCGCSKCLED